MKIGDKTYIPAATNASDIRCPLCAKYLVFKPPCCSDSNSWLVCICGYRKKA